MTLVQTPLQETGVGRSRRWLPAALKRRQRRDRGPERSAPAPSQARAARGRSLLATLRPCRRRRAGVITLHVGVRRSPFSVSLGRPSWYVTAQGGNACPSPHWGPFAVQVTLRAGAGTPEGVIEGASDSHPSALRGGRGGRPAHGPRRRVPASPGSRAPWRRRAPHLSVDGRDVARARGCVHASLVSGAGRLRLRPPLGFAGLRAARSCP